VFELSPDRTVARGRWFLEEQPEIGGEEERSLETGPSRIIGVLPRALKIPTTETSITIVGTHLPTGLAPSDLRLGSNIKVISILKNTGSQVVASPAVANGVVSIGSEDGNEYALNAATGALLWSFATGCPVQSSAAVAGGVVYVGGYDDTGQVYALNETTGAELWSAASGTYAVDSSPAVANGVVYAGTDSNTVEALNAASGAVLWTGTTGNVVTSSPAVVNGAVYVGSDDGSVYAFAQPGGVGAMMSGQARPAISALHPNAALKISR